MRNRMILCAGAALFSGVALLFAFPPHSASGGVVWMAWVPLLLLIRRVEPRAAFWWGWLAGAVQGVVGLSWMMALTRNGGPWPLVVLGQGLLGIYVGLYWGLFAYAAARVWRWSARGAVWRRACALAAEPLLWVGAEWIRGWLLGGFAWNFAGVAVVGSPAVLQVASLGGVYAVSALVLLANGAVAGLVERLGEPFLARLRGEAVAAQPARVRLVRQAETLLPLLLVLVAWGWGQARIRRWQELEPSLPHKRIALVQPNSPCIFSVDDTVTALQRELLVGQTELAGLARPDLVIWPETAVFGVLPQDGDVLRLIRRGVAAARAPLLAGTIVYGRGVDRGGRPELRCYNSAVVFDTNGVWLASYHKRHLVPFGEYVPLDKTFPWLQRFVPAGASCHAGREVVALHLPAPADLLVAPLICFEDTVPPLARDGVRKGARLLVNLTNDAWFGGSCEPIQHFEQAILRAVETGVPLVRAANSGVSGSVNPVGQTSRLTSDSAQADFSGFWFNRVAVPEQPFESPLYLKTGDWLFALPAALFLAALVALPRRRAVDIG